MIEIETWLWGNLLGAIFGLNIICLILCAFSKPFNLDMFCALTSSTIISLLLLLFVTKKDVWSETYKKIGDGEPDE